MSATVPLLSVSLDITLIEVKASSSAIVLVSLTAEGASLTVLTIKLSVIEVAAGGLPATSVQLAANVNTFVLSSTSAVGV